MRTISPQSARFSVILTAEGYKKRSGSSCLSGGHCLCHEHRILSAGISVIPFGYLPTDRIAFWNGYAKPERDALYGWRPEVWWKETE